MSLEREAPEEEDERSSSEYLAEITGEPAESFESDAEIPDVEDQDWEPIQADSE